METVGIGLIGCGLRIQMLLPVIPGLGEKIRVEALCDPNPESVQKTRTQFCPEARVCETYQEVLADPMVKWVMIGSWNCFHREQAVAALEAGKHVFCEKPLATTIEDCLAIKRARDAAGTQFAIGFTLRFSPLYRKVKALLEEGQIGEIVSMEFNETLGFDHGGFIHSDWRRFEKNSGPHLLEKCCHDVDLVQWFIGSLPRRVASFGGLNFFIPENRRHLERVGTNPSGRRAYSGWDFAYHVVDPFTAEKDIIDNQVAILEFENGVRATFHTNCNTNLPERRMYFCGTEGTMRIDANTGRIELRRIGYEEELQELGETIDDGHAGGDPVLGLELAQAMLEGTPPAAGLEDGLTSAITCLAIDQARKTGSVVDLAPLWADLAGSNGKSVTGQANR